MTELKPQFPSLGWRQILTARKEILDAYDLALGQTQAHKVQVLHGRVAEASVRKWLSNFLPARYGVTSGYVVSPGFADSEKTPHFDVIIYDQLASPILWTEKNPDSSSQGASQAIPVEYVQAVLEIKSSLSSRNVADAIEHLRDLLPVMRGADPPAERYKLYLPPTFHCGVLFVELRKEDANSEAALQAFTTGLELRGFFGAVVLRGEGHTLPHTGRIGFFRSETPLQREKAHGTYLLEHGMSATIEVEEKVHVGTMLTWTEMGFAQFAFDLIAMMEGKYEPGRLSSFYGVGSSWQELRRAIEHQDEEP